MVSNVGDTKQEGERKDTRRQKRGKKKRRKRRESKEKKRKKRCETNSEEKMKV